MYQKVDKSVTHSITHQLREDVSKTLPPQRNPVEPGLNSDIRLIQKRVAGWQELNLSAGFDVFHGTTHEHAANIRANGILPVQNGFGGGQLGRGFYTYSTREQAELYAEGGEVLHFRTRRELTGQDVPKGQDWGNLPEAAYENNDFLHIQEDPNQYKFHNGRDDLERIDEGEA